MAQTKEGAVRIAAGKAGITVETYQSRVLAGEKWCWCCRSWKSTDHFSRDRSRHDGLAAACKSCATARSKASYIPRPPRPSRLGTQLVPTRDGDKRQARNSGRASLPNSGPKGRAASSRTCPSTCAFASIRGCLPVHSAPCLFCGPYEVPS